MRGALVIAGRDVRSALTTPLAHVVNAAFLLVAGALFTYYLLQFSDLSDQLRAVAGGDPRIAERLSLDRNVVEPTLKVLSFLLLGLVPLLTMRALAEERRQGTMELLLTSPVALHELVLGKFLGAWALVLVPIALTGFYPLVLVALADPDPGLLLGGYLGLALVAAAFTAIGLLASSLTSSPLVAAFLGFAFLVLCVLAGLVGNSMETNLGTVVAWFSALVHFDGPSAGVLDTADLAYFAIVTFGALFLTLRVVESHRWR